MQIKIPLHSLPFGIDIKYMAVEILIVIIESGSWPVYTSILVL